MFEQDLYSAYFFLEDFARQHWRLQTVFIFMPFFLLFDLPRYLFTRFLTFLLHPRRQKSEENLFRDRAKERLFRERPLVSVIVPSMNEKETILKTIRSLQEQTYNNLQIIISDDCSTDGTYEAALPLARRGEITLIRNSVRGGKSSALNHALQYARGEYVIGIDSDTLFHRRAFENTLYHFYDPEVGAVGGNLRVLNANTNVVTALQGMEYLLSIATGRRFRSRVNILYIVSGAFGAFRRSILQSVHGYSVGPGEDSDITTKVRKKKWRVHFAADAICYTKVPESLYALIKQRFRWNTSMIKIKLRKHRNVTNLEWSNFSITNLIGWLDIVFFQLVLTMTFVIFLFLFLSFKLYTFLTILIIFHVVSSAVVFLEMLIAWSLNGKRNQDIHLFMYILLFSFYKGYFIRLIRASAYLSELLFRVSYKLPFVPQRVRERAERW